MRVLQVNSELSTPGSGTAVSVPSLCRALARTGQRVELFTLLPVSVEIDTAVEVYGFHRWRFPKPLGISIRLYRALKSEAKTAAILHSHSLWMMPVMVPQWCVRRTGCKLIVSPRGTLSQWAVNNARWKKALVWPMQRGTLVAADCIHATAEEEYEDIRARGFDAPVAVIPNGVEVPPESGVPPRSGGEHPKRLLFLSRVHPKKGLPRLIRAWSRLEGAHPDWELIVAGSSERNHLEELESLAAGLGVQRVRFVGPAYGERKAALYRGASAFVLPTHSENFGIVVAEALAYGVPVITTRGAPWRGVEVHRCGWWVENSEAGIEDGLQKALNAPDETLVEMGQRGRRWMAEEFSWDSIAKSMLRTYQWLSEGGETPPWVRSA